MSCGMADIHYSSQFTDLMHVCTKLVPVLYLHVHAIIVKIHKLIFYQNHVCISYLKSVFIAFSINLCLFDGDASTFAYAYKLLA